MNEEKQVLEHEHVEQWDFSVSCPGGTVESGHDGITQDVTEKNSTIW